MNELTRDIPLRSPDDAPDPAGYERDFALWIDAQLEILRARKFEQLDLDNIIEEFDAMGKHQRRELKSRLDVLLVHLLKCEFQAEHKSRSWLQTLRVQRSEILRLLEDSPSLQPQVAKFSDEVYGSAVDQAAIQTGLQRSVFPNKIPYTAEQLLDPDFVP
jgi:hypothetical protein